MNFNIKTPPLSSAAAVLLFVATASAAAAQEPRGIASQYPTCLIVDTANPNNARNGKILLKARGDKSSAPPIWERPAFMPHVPDYGQVSATGLFSLYSDIEINAHSSGNSRVPRVDGSGEVELTQGNAWLALTLTLDLGETGSPGSLFRRAHNRFGNAAGELISYYFEGSQGVAPMFVDAARTEMSRNNIRLTGGHLNSAIKAQDFGLGLLTFADEAMGEQMLYQRLHYYFSVSDSWAQANSSITNFAQTDTGIPRRPDAGTIYVRYWNSSSGTWTTPEIYASPGELGLSNQEHAPYSIPGVDIDALDVNSAQDVVVLSLAGDYDSELNIDQSEYSQLMIYQKADPNAYVNKPKVGPTAMKTETGARVTHKSGAGAVGSSENEVTSACTIDPEGGAADTLMGLPTNDYSGPAPISISMVRLRNRNSGTEAPLFIQATGPEYLPVDLASYVVFEYRTPGNPQWTLLKTGPIRAGITALAVDYLDTPMLTPGQRYLFRARIPSTNPLNDYLSPVFQLKMP